MAKQTINDSEFGSVIRAKINDNFTEVYDGKADLIHDHDADYEPIDATILKQADIGTLVADENHTHGELHSHSNKTLLDSLQDDGSPSLYLAQDGTYRVADSSGEFASTSDVVAMVIALGQLMANTFKKASALVTDSATTVYTTPANTTTIVIGCLLANKLATLVYVDILLGTLYLGKDIPIPAGASLSPLDGKWVLETGDVLKVTASEADSLDAYLSIMEVT